MSVVDMDNGKKIELGTPMIAAVNACHQQEIYFRRFSAIIVTILLSIRSIMFLHLFDASAKGRIIGIFGRFYPS